MADLKRRIIAEFSAKNKAKGVLGGFRRDLDTTGRALRRMAMGALAVAGVGGFGYMIKRQMEAIDVTAKLSDRLGIGTEALIGLQHAASISGVEQETLNKSLEIFSRRLGEVRMGVGQAKYALDGLGLSADSLVDKSPEQALGIIADQINKLETASDKAAATNYLFGRSGQQLLNMFEKGSAGIEAMRKEAEKLGLTFSRFDAGQVEAANDALTRARAVLTGLFRQATIELAPYIEVIADKFVDIATSGEGLGSNVVNAFEQMSLAAVHFGGLIHKIPAYWKGIEAGARDTLAAIYDIADAATNLDVLFKKLKRPGWEKTYKELAEEQRKIATDLKVAGGKELAGVYGKEQEDAVTRFYDNLNKKAAERRGAFESGNGPLQAAGLGMEPLDESAMQEHYDKLTVMGGTYQEMQERMARQRIETEIAAVTQQMEAEEKIREEAAERRKRIAEDIAVTMARSWSSAIDQMMFEGKKFWAAMSNMARSLFREIANIIIYKTIAEKMAYGIMGLPVPTAQHGGEVMRTGLAVIHKGETFSGVSGGGGPAKFDVHVHNEGQEKLEISDVESYLVSDKRIINVTMQAMQTDLKYRRSIKQVR